MSWICNQCESLNSDERIICEVCNSISPVLVKFNFKYEENNKAIIEWQAENACRVTALFNSHTYDISNWKSARISLLCTLTIIAITVSNAVTDRIYTFGIPKL